MRFYKIIAGLLISSTFLGGCFSVPEFPLTPEIEFDRISSVPRLDQTIGAYKDSIVISVKFKDGDGDLGYEQREIDSLRQRGGGQNFIIKQFRKDKGKYVEYIPLDPLPLYFHRLSSDKPGPLEGIIHYNGVQLLHSFYPYARDTIRFEVYIKDRAGNTSNTVVTDSVVVRTL